MFVKEERVHGGEGGLHNGPHISRGQVGGLVGKNGEGALRPHGQVLYCTERGVDLEQTVGSITQSSGGGFVRAVDV